MQLIHNLSKVKLLILNKNSTLILSFLINNNNDTAFIQNLRGNRPK